MTGQGATRWRVTTFPGRREFERGASRLRAAGAAFEVISPDPAYRLVGAPAIRLGEGALPALTGGRRDGVLVSGWVDDGRAPASVPGDEPPAFKEDVFGEASIMVLAPCVADRTRIRIVAHISGDLAAVFPYLNAELAAASYNRHGPTFTFLDGYRMIALYPGRITVAKADEIVDAWRTLEMIRRQVNEVWARRGEIEPSWERREKPPALEIFRRLPRTNCRACGEQTCLAFAVKVWLGEVSVAQCRPVFAGDAGGLRDALVEVCAGLGVADGLPVTG